MNRAISTSIPLPGSDQPADREFKGKRLHPPDQTQRDSDNGKGRIKIEPDQQAILALARLSRAHVHRANGLIQAYTSACYLGELEIAEAAKHEMTVLAVKCIREIAGVGLGMEIRDSP